LTDDLGSVSTLYVCRGCGTEHLYKDTLWDKLREGRFRMRCHKVGCRSFDFAVMEEEV